MGRPHIEFIQSQQLEWETPEWAWGRPGVACKRLSEAPETGACSALVRYPAGWEQHADGWLDATEELYVLEGDLSVNGTRLENDSYAYFPTGYPRHSLSSEQGAVVLTFFSQAPVLKAGTSEYDESALINGLDAFAVPWKAGFDPVYADAGLCSKTLRHDEDAQDRTFMVTIPPHVAPENWRGRQERHDCVEEMFLISGDFLSNVGVMRQGAYFWRPPGIAHGPYGTRNGNICLIRTLGHKLENNWTDYEIDISKAPPYTPFLPEELEPLAKEEWDEGTRY